MESSQLWTRARTVTWADVSCYETDQQRPRTASDPRPSCITTGIHAHLLHGSILDESKEETCWGKNLIENLSFNIGRLVPSPPPMPQQGYFKQKGQKKALSWQVQIFLSSSKITKAPKQMISYTKLQYIKFAYMSCSLQIPTLL